MADELKEAQTQVIMRVIDSLLATYERRHYGDAADIKVSYMLATARFDPGVIIKALNNFLEGKVDDHEKDLLPTAPELAAECQYLDYQREADEFDIGGGMAEIVASDPAIQRRAELSRRLTDTAEAVDGLDNVTPLRRPVTSDMPKGAA